MSYPGGGGGGVGRGKHVLQLERFHFHGLLIVFHWIIKFLSCRKLNIQCALLSMYTYMYTNT